MKNFTNTAFKLLITTFFVSLNYPLLAQNEPFYCESNAYLFQFNDVYAIDLASGNSFLVASDVTAGNINAVAYNPSDGYIWGYLSSPSNTIVRIGKDFSTTTYYIPELTAGNKYVGDISANGIYYFKAGGSTYYKVDVNPASPNYGRYLSTEELSQGLSVHDWAFNAVDGQLYTVEQNSNILYRINPDNGVVTSLGVVPILSGLSYTYGAVYFDASGSFYVSANQTGTIYIINDVQTLNGTNIIDSNLFAFGPASSSNDGARCPTAPVAKEDCSNGIDDDGDGLVDCEDPSCSGYGSCPVVDALSGGNDGGLESNNRLAEQINKRNFDRAKKSYTFNRTTAKRVTKSLDYCVRRDANSNFTLPDFIPLGAINEDVVLETTPSDLLGITNATEVYSVDYMKNDKSIASILALKTENGVYEHTKYICDRLIGAELLSVSTIEISGQSFIKSIIKNADGSVEFVLSLSAKIVNNDANFAIESHWNLDRYEANVTFYNFQIWTNSIDHLFDLGSEVLHLINAQKTIANYNNSDAPTVFVRKGKYVNGVLDLEIVNTNATEMITFDAGIRTSETNPVETVSTPVSLNDNYVTSIAMSTGNLFDVGFRIGDGVHTPDDLFLSDGPWGVDDAATTTTISSYTVLPSTTIYEVDEFPIERNVVLRATTSEYVAAYRAITPRYKAVDLSDFSSFKLEAMGTGKLEITFVKESIGSWEAQFKTSITLTDTFTAFAIPFSAFSSTNGGDLVLNDIKTIVFTMVSADGRLVTKEMDLKNIRFSKEVIEVFDASDLELITVQPNPMITSSSFHFVSLQAEPISVFVYNQLGELVSQKSYSTTVGRNEINMERGNLSTGMYFCKLVSQSYEYKTVKLLVR